MTDTDDLEFSPLFDFRNEDEVARAARSDAGHLDRRDGAVYQMSSELHLAVEVALTTGRPLLLRGDPGTGKSSLAPYVARRLNWRYYEFVTTSKTVATDLQWRFDAVRRLADAQADKVKGEEEYLDPGVLWWALDRPSAQKYANEPHAETNQGRDAHRAVVLIDEIDKAHPDVPNGLLVALGSNRISIPYLNDPITAGSGEAPPLDLPREVEIGRVLVVVTTNEERELPRAFLRRCVTYRLSHPDGDELAAIAALHFSDSEQPFDVDETNLAKALANRVVKLREQTKPDQHKPSTAEFLDAFRACRGFVSYNPKDPRWQLIERVTLAKPGREVD